jgi:hypothetical protein
MTQSKKASSSLSEHGDNNDVKINDGKSRLRSPACIRATSTLMRPIPVLFSILVGRGILQIEHAHR